MNSKQIKSMPNLAIVSVLSATLVALSGCGSSEEVFQRAAVRGMVTVDGTPLKEGKIRFIPDQGSGGGKHTISIRDGIFDVNQNHGPVACFQRIEIVATNYDVVEPDNIAAMQKIYQGKAKLPKVMKIPAKYNKNSTLREELSAEGVNDLTFELVTAQK